MNKLLAIIKKDFLTEISYRFAFVMNFVSILTTILTYYFIDKLFGHQVAPHLQEFGVNYFSYVLLSMAFFSYIGVGVGSFSYRIRNEQLQGTLEALLLSPTKIYVILLGMGLWNLIFATLDVIIYILFGIFLFKISFASINLLSTFLILILTIITFSSLGILSASFVLVFKKGNPVAWVINAVEGLIGGVYFPITVMPEPLQLLAKFFPITHAIRALELAVYKGYSVFQLSTEILLLVLFSVLLLPLGLFAFNFALDKARKDGSLVQY
ncbi:ABC transporter permease [Candidatus Margulisiibacteriota bacterium]